MWTDDWIAPSRWTDNWIVLAKARLAAGDVTGARFAAMVANDEGAPCPFSDPVLAEGWAAADDLRARVRRRQVKPAPGWKPKSGSTHAAHTADHIAGLDL